ncbi:MAG: aminotransferase class V-fold PLP-dependent enzyme [Dehalococcoidia bacterium]
MISYNERNPAHGPAGGALTNQFLAMRAQIPALRKVTYLNSGWSGPSPQRVVDRVVDYLRWEAEEGPTSPHVLARAFSLNNEIRLGVAAAFNAEPDEIVVTANTTEGINHVLNGLPWVAGDEVLAYNFEHSSVLIPLYQLRDQRGIKLNRVALATTDSPDEIVAKFEAAMTDNTRLLALSHISYSTGLRLPLERIVAMAKAHDAQVLVDGAQTAGQLALDLPATGADYYAFTGHKWMLGPEGAGALYVRRERLERLRPTAVSVYAAESYDYDGRFVPKTGSPAKFALTTIKPAIFNGFLEALAVYREVGPAAIEARARALGLDLRARLAAIPGVTFVSPEREDTACGLVCFQVAGQTPSEVVQRVWERRRIVVRAVDFPKVIRAACHYFNTEDDLAALADEIAAIA